MITVTVDRHIDVAALPFPASTRWDGTSCHITADATEDELRATLAAALTVDEVQRERATRRDQAVAMLNHMAASDPTTWTKQQQRRLARILAIVVERADLDPGN